VKLLRLAILATWALLGCSSEADAKRALESSGYSHIELTGTRWFGCGENETADGFQATNPRGQQVTGIVCCGLAFKGCTVRF